MALTGVHLLAASWLVIAAPGWEEAHSDLDGELLARYQAAAALTYAGAAAFAGDIPSAWLGRWRLCPDLPRSPSS